MTQKASKFNIVGLNINNISITDLLIRINELIKSQRPGYICFANSHMAVESIKDNDFAKKLNQATLILPDGMPIAKSFSLIHGIRQERIPGMDFLPKLLNLCNDNKYRVFILGSTEDTISKAINRVSSTFSQVTVCGFFSPDFNCPWDNEKIVSNINNSKPDVVIVALGCPKQEKWMFNHSSKINSVLFGLGGALPVFAGTSKNAPKWMKNNGLEWLFRLILEPKRLWKRYLVTNTLISWYILKQYINSKIKY